MKLYRLRYSPYARKVQILLDLLGAKYECVEVPYGRRDELAFFGASPTLADAALYGECAMIEEADKALLSRISPTLEPYLRAIERFAAELREDRAGG